MYSILHISRTQYIGLCVYIGVYEKEFGNNENRMLVGMNGVSLFVSANTTGLFDM